MGYIAHHAIVVTGTSGYGIEAAHAKAVEVFTDIDRPQSNTQRLVSPLIASLTNGYASFLVAPDGSKEGWGTSDNGNEARATLIAYLREQDDCDWIEVRYGGDDYDFAYIDAHGGDTAEPVADTTKASTE